MNNIDAIAEKVEHREKQLQELFKKDEDNYNLWMGKEQKFDTHPMAVNITGTEMTALSLKVQSSLVRSRLDIRVLPPEGHPNPEAERQANQEERMYYFGLNKADERLGFLGESPLLPTIAWQAVNLGRTALLALVYEEDGEVIWHIQPLYPRFFIFEYDSKGLAWGCYETFRSPAAIKAEYGKEVPEDLVGKGVSVRDYWDRQHNVRYITKGKEKLGKTWKHPFGEVPIIFQPVSRSPRAVTNEGVDVTLWGESIFDHVSGPFKKLNEMRSIAATHAHLIAKAPLDVTYDGDAPDITEEHFNYHPSAVFKHPASVKISSMEIRDIPQSLAAMMADLKAGIDRATFTELNPDSPGHSGSALRILGQDKKDVMSPRMQTMNTTCTRLCRMLKRQITVQGLEIPVRTVVNESYNVYNINPELLDNDFYVSAELVTQDVYDEVESLQRAQMYQQNRWKSRESIMEQILLETDTPTEIDKMDTEDVESAIPELKLKKVIMSYMKRGMEDEAKMATEQLAMLLIEKQQMLQHSMQPQGEPEGPPREPPGGQPMRPPMRGQV